MIGHNIEFLSRSFEIWSFFVIFVLAAVLKHFNICHISKQEEWFALQLLLLPRHRHMSEQQSVSTILQSIVRQVLIQSLFPVGLLLNPYLVKLLALCTNLRVINLYKQKPTTKTIRVQKPCQTPDQTQNVFTPKNKNIFHQSDVWFHQRRWSKQDLLLPRKSGMVFLAFDRHCEHGPRQYQFVI